MPLTVASWNIEKNGQSSPEEKQKKVDTFLDVCCGDEAGYKISVIFLCEIHSARPIDYLTALIVRYGEEYNVQHYPGGNSNGYILLTKIELNIEVGFDTLRGLNRRILYLNYADLHITLAHFKSGQKRLTVRQLRDASEAVRALSRDGKWAIIGDINYDYSKFNLLNLNNTKRVTCWTDQTQAKGGILDWCLASTQTTVIAQDMLSMFLNHSLFNMEGPDHKPVIFTLL